MPDVESAEDEHYTHSQMDSQADNNIDVDAPIVMSAMKPGCDTSTSPQQGQLGSTETEETPTSSTSSKIAEGLFEEQQKEIESLLDEYGDIFANSAMTLGRTAVFTHKIDTGQHLPVNSQPYRSGPGERSEMERQVEDMRKSGVIEPSTSAWASPVVLVQKKDGSKRFCADYRKVTKLTKNDRYPLLRVDDTLDLLAGQKYFTSLDLKSGYWQIPIDPQDAEKAAFITPFGLWQFNVMPFCLCNAPRYFPEDNGQGASCTEMAHLLGLSR